MTPSFADEVRARLPAALHLPDAFAAVFDWAEAQGQRDVFRRGDSADFGSHYLSIYPPGQMEAAGASYVIFNFEAGPPIHAPGEAMLARIATVAKIAGDGGRLGFWCDADGVQQIVVFNHGIPYVLTADPVVAVQFLGLGYPEPACLEDPTISPEEEMAFPGAPPLMLPLGYRDFLTARFGRPLPRTAADLGLRIPAFDDSDPLRDWMEAETQDPDPSTVPGLTADNPFVVSADLAAKLGPEGLAAIRSAYPFVKIET
ncbi:hypothetical protein [Roseicyclus mahoneyensis]|uniref:Uncharacterized protein n=1 Tax=Roseicyclus mahoneyensis TaxID=164332 RepID=A0A316GG26_9RHOB|nr:hypothetical protein [Roseicyclus mahoneyensis]PWK59937.1 hypothetical protein C7455_106225 [Roseicyclus mahoneyensis]